MIDSDGPSYYSKVLETNLEVERAATKHDLQLMSKDEQIKDLRKVLDTTKRDLGQAMTRAKGYVSVENPDGAACGHCLSS